MSRQSQYQQSLRDSRNELGPMPEVADAELLRRVTESAESFYLELFPEIFSDPFGSVQKSSIEHEQHALRNSGAVSLNKLEPRGYGKSVRSILGAIRALLLGDQRFVLICCANIGKAGDLLRIGLKELSTNDHLLACWPELYAFRHLQMQSQRAPYQVWNGKPTKIAIKAEMIRFPVFDGSRASEGGLLITCPYSKARGYNVEAQRPTAVILDDVQSTEEAMSPTSTAKNVKILTADIAFLGTRKAPVTIVNNATVIQDDDFPSRVAKLKSFTTVRYKMVEAFPDNEELWEKYQGIRQTYDTESPHDRDRAAIEARKFYEEHREEMDRGSKVTWEHAYSPAKQEISTIQAAMNFIADFGQASFDSECQNDPSTEDQTSLELLTVDAIMGKQTNTAQMVVPLECSTLVGMVDVHENILDFELWAYDGRFGGTKIWGGTWPDQKTHSFRHPRPPKPLQKVYSGMTDTARIDAGLNDLFQELLGREYQREDETVMRVKRLLVDANGVHSDTIQKTCRRSKWANVLTPSFGMGITAKKLPISRLPNNKGRQDIGPEWAPRKAKAGQLPSVIFDSNYWKTQFHKQLAMPPGQHGSLMMHYAKNPEQHRRSAVGYRAEKPIEVTAHGRTIHEWSIINAEENHPLDCAVGSMVAASMCGISSSPRISRKKRRRRVRQ